MQEIILDLSHTYPPEIQNEFIGILANSVKQRLIGHVIQSKYFGLLVDSTPDLAHREQLSQVIRFFDINFVSKKFFWVL